jgi:hypothetical protein
LDKSVWVPAGQKIDAAQFTSCNLADNIGINGSWSDIVISMPTNDTDKSAGILDIRNFTNNKWVEYQVNLTSAKNYTLTLRYRTAQSTNMQITVDGGTAVPATLDSGAWTETGIALGNLSAGNHTLRLRVTNGNSAGSGAADTEGNFYTAGAAVNWLRMD